MTRTSTFTVATLAVIAVVSLASTSASAHGGGGSFGGGFAGSGGRGFGGSTSAPVGNAHGPLSASGIARSPIVPRLVGAVKPVRQIPTQTVISQLPKAPPPPPGNNNKPGWGSAGRGGFAAGVSVDVSTDNCLIKQYLPNGRVMFRDLCTSETALAR